MSSTYEFTLTCTLPGSAQAIFDAWMSSEGHTAMTGAVAHIDPREGGAFDAYDGYISGTTLQLDPPHRIVQTWRTAQFKDEHEDSQIEVTLSEQQGQTQLTLRHFNVPAEQKDYEQGGWQTHYFDRMHQRFTLLQDMAKLLP